MLRKLALSLAVAGALVSTQVNALGLGDIKIKSALNEPLSAEIKLHQIRDLNPLQIRPRMANQDEFALAGLSQQRALSDIRFQVKVNPNGTGVILLTSREPVKEPFINFLVEVNWPSGRLVREYTLLLDPPVFDPSPTQKIVAPAVSTPINTRSSTQVNTSSTRQTKSASNIRSRADKKTQAYVDVQDTLWGLAIENRVAPDVSSYQMMVAMHKKNPQAFPDGNINNLKAGVVINLPTEAEARAVSSAQAAVEVHRQTALWKQGGAPAQDKAPIDGSKKSLKSEAAESQETNDADAGQLKVVTPAESVNKDDAAVDGQNSQTKDLDKQQLIEKNESLENQLAVSMESIDRLERDNVDLNDKLDAIQEQLDSLQRLIQLKDQQLATLQSEVSKPPLPVTPPPPPPPEKSLIDKILQAPEYLAGIGGGLIAVLAGLWLMMRRKKKAEDAVEEEEFFNAVDLDESSDLDEESQLAELEEASDDLAEAAAEAASDERSENVASGEFDLNDDLDDLDDLNLDMDLDLDDSFDDDLDVMAIEDAIDDNSADSDESDIDDGDDLLGSILDESDDDEFDLGLDELADMDSATDLDLEEQEPAESSSDDEFELGELSDSALAADTALDDLLAEDSAEEEAIEKARSGLGMVDSVSQDDEIDETLESLGLGELDDELVTADEPADEEDDDLEFNLSDVEPDEPSQEMKDLESELDELDFELDNLDLDMSEETAKSGAALELNESDLDLETDLMADLDSLLEDDAQEEVADTSSSNDSGIAETLASLDEESASVDDLDDFGDLDDVLGFEEEDVVGEEPIVEEAATLLDQDIVEADDFSEDAADLLDDLEPQESDSSESNDEPMDLAGFDLDDLSGDDSLNELPGTPSDEEVTRELTSNIEHDLDAELDDELEALLNSTDNDIALEESLSDDEPSLDALGFLDGADEVETKLDLARAYIDMDDVEGAKDILEEIAQEGNDSQKAEATELLGGLV